jgi:hypothetical protein
MANFRFPEDIESNSGDYIKFEFFEYRSPIAGAAAGSFSSYQSEIPRGKRGVSIFLTMPSDIQSNFSGAWGGKETTSLAQAALGAVAGVANFATTGDINTLKSKTTFLNDPAKAFKSTLKALGDDTIKYLADSFAKLPGLGANLGPNDVLQLTTGNILNPNTELLYGGLGLRSHGYSFKMIPRTKGEATAMINIVQAFKEACLPDSGGAIFGTDGRNFLKVPDLCEVTFWRRNENGNGILENEYLPKYKLSGITSVNVSYVTDGNYMAFTDGKPMGIQLTVGFTETKLVFRDDVKTKGYR